MSQLRKSDITKRRHGVVDDDELGPPDSQALEDQYVKQIAQTLKSATQRRQQARRARIRQKHDATVNQLRAEINATFAEHSKRMRQLHKSRLLNLSNLLKRRFAVELEIIKSTKKLERAYTAANNELFAVLGARINH